MSIIEASITLFLCGDVMTGRGIDQALPHSVDPRLYEPYIRNARSYLRLAEEENGNIPTPLSYAYLWGDALTELERRRPDRRLINLETSITNSDDHWPNKGIHYRMHPKNVACLSAAAIDGCALANNHVLDWGYNGLYETLATLENAGIDLAGAGRNERQATAPAVWEAPGGRVVVFSCGARDSGIPLEWAATGQHAGVFLLDDFSEAAAGYLASLIEPYRQPATVVVCSIHWGGNWGYAIPPRHRDFAHRLIDEAGVDLIHGHSSHHFKGIEVYRNKLILYGCGDFITDYEGISGKEQYRGELALAYFPALNPADGQLIRLEMTPLLLRRFRLRYPAEADINWAKDVLNREGRLLGTRVERSGEGALRLAW